MSVGEITFLRPAWLLALLPLGLLLWRMARHGDQRKSGWVAVVDARLLPHLLLAGSPAGRLIGAAVLGVALCLALLALAGPSVPGAVDFAYRSDAARLLVVDQSAAMGGGETPSPRMERTRLKLLDLLQAAPQGQTGLVAYAEEPYLVAPLTTDVATIALLVPELSPHIMPLAGDRPERALRMATDILVRSGAQQLDLVWISASAATPAVLDALRTAKAANVRVSMLRPDAAEDDVLRQTVEAGGGLYLALQPDGDDVRALAELFDASLLRVAAAQAGTFAARDLGPWLLLLLLPLAALAFRRGLLLMLALPLLMMPPPAEALDLQGWWLRADQRGWRLLQTGEAETAATQFSDARWRAVAFYRAGRFDAAAAVLAPLADADSLYNRGNALARLGRLPEALAVFDRALRLRPDDADFRHNRLLVLRLLNPPPPEPEAQGNPPAADSSAPEKNKLPDRNPDKNRSGDDGAGPSQAMPSLSQPGANARQKPAPSADASLKGQSGPEREADLLAEQWLRRVPADQSSLLQRKLMLEHERRQAGKARQPWQEAP